MHSNFNAKILKLSDKYITNVISRYRNNLIREEYRRCRRIMIGIEEAIYCKNNNKSLETDTDEYLKHKLSILNFFDDYGSIPTTEKEGAIAYEEKWIEYIATNFDMKKYNVRRIINSVEPLNI